VTAAELKAALDLIHWGPVQLGAGAGVARQTAFRWIAGETAIPHRIAAWLTDLARYHAAHPAPPAPPASHPETNKRRARKAGYYVTGSPELGYRVASLTGDAGGPPGPDYKTRREAWAAAAALASAEPSKSV
jgi:hypothetical protein